jgi:hypothetical protein
LTEGPGLLRAGIAISCSSGVRPPAYPVAPRRTAPVTCDRAVDTASGPDEVRGRVDSTESVVPSLF